MSRLAVVTGGTRGIGAAISEGLNAAGYKVAAVYVGNEAAASEFTERTGIPSYRFNVGDIEACVEGMKKLEAELGAVDILVNNAGITRDRVLHKMRIEEWDDVIRTNLTSVFAMSRRVIPGMRARGFGRIINISSVNGQAGQIGQTNYAAAKAAVIGFSRSLALESASKGITVNVIAPGYIDTEMVRAVPPDVLDGIIGRIPVGHLGTPDDIARLVVFLASTQASFITGATYAVNGGQYFG